MKIHFPVEDLVVRRKLEIVPEEEQTWRAPTAAQAKIYPKRAIAS